MADASLHKPMPEFRTRVCHLPTRVDATERIATRDRSRPGEGLCWRSSRAEARELPAVGRCHSAERHIRWAAF